MISKVIIAALSLSSISAESKHRFSRHHELAKYTFDDYLRESGKKYDDSEKEMRREVFAKNLKIIREHNAGKHSW